MEPSFLVFSEEFTSSISFASSLPNFRDFIELPQKRKNTEDSGGYKLSRFPQLPSKDFLCLLCSNVLKKPLECRKCGKLFCDTCVGSLKQYDKANRTSIFCCSNCNSSLEPRQPSIVLIRMISELLIKCVNFDEGCSNLIPIEDINKHELVCPYREVYCENKSCRKSGLIKDFIESECSFRSIISHFSNRANGRNRSYTCSENCKKIVGFEKLVFDKQHHKALNEYFNLLTKSNQSGKEDL